MSESCKGRCFCGAVTFEAAGAPLEMGLCHCASCRAYSGGPLSGYLLWPSEAIAVTGGAEHLRGFNRTGMSERRFCVLCGGHVMSVHPSMGLTDIRPGAMPDVAFRPTVHLNYAETVMRVHDGLTKLRDFPAEAGGSGETVAE